MTEIMYYTASTLNGFLADDDNSLEWLFAVPAGDDPAGSPDYPAFFESTGVLVEGSTTYEWVLEHESLENNPERWTKLYGDRPTFVFTSRDLAVPAEADVRFVHGAVADSLDEIRRAAGDKNIWIVGGGELAGQFLDLDALDTLIVSIAPALLASGAPLLPRRIGADRLKLRSVGRFGQFAHVIYDVADKTPSAEE